MAEQLAYRQGSERWLDFFSFWQRDPIGMVNLCGHALGQNAIYTENFFDAYGKSLFNHWKVPERIDFLYDHPNAKPSQNKQCDFDDSVYWGVDSQVPWIIDLDGRYQYLGIALFRNLDLERNIYAIRTFLPDLYETDPPASSWNGPLDVFEGITGRTLTTGGKSCHHFIEHGGAFWNFTKENDVIELPNQSRGFYDMMTTKKVAHMLLWTTNMLGFS